MEGASFEILLICSPRCNDNETPRYYDSHIFEGFLETLFLVDHGEQRADEHKGEHAKKSKFLQRSYTYKFKNTVLEAYFVGASIDQFRERFFRDTNNNGVRRHNNI
jgi:hypothetical protein